MQWSNDSEKLDQMAYQLKTGVLRFDKVAEDVLRRYIKKYDIDGRLDASVDHLTGQPSWMEKDPATRRTILTTYCTERLTGRSDSIRFEPPITATITIAARTVPSHTKPAAGGAALLEDNTTHTHTTSAASEISVVETAAAVKARLNAKMGRQLGARPRARPPAPPEPEGPPPGTVRPLLYRPAAVPYHSMLYRPTAVPYHSMLYRTAHCCTTPLNAVPYHSPCRSPLPGMVLLWKTSWPRPRTSPTNDVAATTTLPLPATAPLPAPSPLPPPLRGPLPLSVPHPHPLRPHPQQLPFAVPQPEQRELEVSVQCPPERVTSPKHVRMGIQPSSSV